MYTAIAPTFWHAFWSMVILHCLFDFPLQGPFLSHAKNSKAPMKGVSWEIALAAHSAMHAGAVWVVTGMPTLAFGEFALHALIDHLKNWGAFEGVHSNTAFERDQLMHVLCKLAWAAIWMSTHKL